MAPVSTLDQHFDTIIDLTLARYRERGRPLPKREVESFLHSLRTVNMLDRLAPSMKQRAASSSLEKLASR